ncbi:MAG TPA: MBL fold metallo-hydrolase, partial [Anaeromyxobacter sp.]
EDDVAFVARQPASPAARRRAMMALVACPVAAIGSSRSGRAKGQPDEAAPERAGGPGGREPKASVPTEVMLAAHAFPYEVTPGVLDCGYAAESSFGAASWLVLRPEGNVLVDSPRFAAPLAGRIRALGGVRLMFLTHRDDVADHARWAEVLGCERALHARDLSAGTRGVERVLEGDAPIPLAPGVTAIPVPGHTAGSTALHVDDELLFTGDHLWGDAEGRLGASRAVCWHDWGEQTASMEKLGALRFRRVFPGHGRPWHAPSAEVARREVLALARAMRGERR